VTDPQVSPDPTDDHPAATDDHPAATDDTPPLDLARIAADLDGVDIALRRLDDGTYWTDEQTGDELPDELLAANPIARRIEQN
jgi:RNA polymerase-binding transcription factor DksA